MERSEDKGRTDQLEELFEVYLNAFNAGDPLDRDAIRRDHPEFAEELIEQLEFFENLGSRATEAPLGTLGDYTLRRQIGRGGMGVVYEAWENSMDRAVALKVLPAGVAADDRAFRRFMQEAKTAGKLSHPNVVPVYFTGMKEQTPFYAMEFVNGETLAQILARVKDSEAEAETPFGAKDEVAYFHNMAKAFADVADGLQHAHQKGVTHRDVKPSNLILDQGGRLRILDFGLARLEGQESLTHSDDFVGTPLYMSPEQARRRKIAVDHRTDIYSLGATFYEALTGRPPFRGKDHQDTLSQIISRDPVEPRNLNRRVPEDLATVVLKCLRKDAGDRYSTAEALGQDLRRFARGDPIEARPQSRLERLVRAASRHRTALGVTAAALLVLVATLGAGTFLVWSAKKETEEALADSRRRAEETKAIADFLVKDLLGSAAPARARARSPTVVEVLADAERKVAALNAQPRLEAAVRRVIGDTYAQLGRYGRAEEQLGAAYELASSEYGPESPVALEALNSLGFVHLRQGKLGEAGKELRACVEAADGPRSRERIDLLHRARINLAAVLMREGKKREACELCRSTLELYQETHGRPDLAGMRMFAASLEDTNELEEARRVYKELIVMQEKELGPDHPEVLMGRANFAILLEKEGKLEEARTLNEDVLERRRKVLGPEHAFTLASMNNLALVLEGQGELAEARKLHERVLALRLRDLGESHFETLGTMSNLAGVLARQGEHERALELNERAVAVAVGAHGAEHHWTLRLKKDLASRWIEAKEYERALEVQKDLLHERVKSQGRQHPETLGLMFDLANLHRTLGDAEEARRLHEETLELRRKVLGPEHRDTLRSANNLAVALFDTGKSAEAARLHRETLETRIGVLGGGDPETLSSLRNWVSARSRRWRGLREAGRWPEAVNDWREVVRHLETWSRQNEDVAEYSDALAHSLNNLAWDLAVSPDASVREPEEAVRLARRAVDFLLEGEKTLGVADARAGRSSRPSPLGGYWSTLGTCYTVAGRWRDAVDAFEKALPLRRGGDAYDWFGLALALAKLGTAEEAREWYERGKEWQNANAAALRKSPLAFEEVERLRGDAARALRTEAKQENE